MSLRRLLVLVAIFIISVPPAFLLYTGRVWWRSSRYTVTVDNQPVRGAPVYAGKNVILVDLRSTGDESYLIYPKYRELGQAQDSFFYQLGFCVVSYQKPAVYIPIAKILEVRTHEQFGPGFVRFLSAERKDVVVRW